MSSGRIIMSAALVLSLLSLGSISASAATSPNKQMNTLGSQEKKGPATDAREPEANPVLYENYQQCYANLISDVIGRPAEELDARKNMIKKYCKAMSRVKYQKKFSDCYNGSMGSGNSIDAIIEECLSRNDKPDK